MKYLTLLHHDYVALEPITVSFEQEAFTTNEGTKLSFALEISGPGFGSAPSPGGIQGGFDPQRDLGLVLVDGSPIALCESRMYNSNNKQRCLRETVVLIIDSNLGDFGSGSGSGSGFSYGNSTINSNSTVRISNNTRFGNNYQPGTYVYHRM